MNKKLQKIFILVICFMMLVSLGFTIGTSAEDTVGTVTVKSDDVLVGRGQQFTTTVYVDAGSNLANLSMTLEFDANVVAFVNYSASSNVEVSVLANKIVVVASYEENLVNKTNLVDLTFETDEQIAKGTTSGWLKKVAGDDTADECTTMVGESFANLAVNSTFGNIIVRKVGDVYNNKNDGKINARDASRILQHVARIVEIPENELVYANAYEDYNADGSPKINARDASVILQYVARIRTKIENRFDLTFYGADGEVYLAKSVKSGDELNNIPAVPTASGKSGVWSLSKDSYIAPNFDNVTEDVEIYPFYTNNIYTLTVVYGNGQENGVYDLAYGDAVPAISNPEREGYTFIGWDKEIPSTMPEGDLTITAEWTINQYTLTIVYGNGQPNKVITQDYNTAIESIADPVWAGHAFRGWDKEIPSTMPAENLTITASWKQSAYSVTLVYNNGEDNGVFYFDEGEELVIPDPVREGYSFNGWDTTIPDVMPAKNLTFNARWSVNTYTLRYRSFVGSTWKKKTYTYGARITVPTNPVRTGYIFTGWDTPFPTTMPAYDLDITGTWEVVKNTVTFDLNGAKGYIAPVDVDSGKKVSAPDISGITMPSANCTFAYWADENGIEYNFNNVVNKDITLYAIYSGTVNVTVNWMIGDKEKNIVTDIRWGSTIRIPEYTTVNHYPENAVFDGFYYEDGVEYDTYDEIKRDTVLKARWVDDGSFDDVTFTYEAVPNVDYSSSIGSSTGVDLSDGGSVSMTFDVLGAHTFANVQTKVSALSWIPGLLSDGYNNYWQGCGSIGLAGNPAYTEDQANYYGYLSGILPDTFVDDGHIIFGQKTANPNLVMRKGVTIKAVFTAPTQTTTGSIVYYSKAIGADDAEYVEECSMRNILLSDVYNMGEVYLWLDFYNCSAGPGATMTFNNFKVEYDGLELPLMFFNHYEQEFVMSGNFAVVPTYEIGVGAVENGNYQIGWLMSDTATPTQNGGTLTLEMDVVESNLATHNVDVGVALFNYLGVSNDWASGFHDSQWVGNPMYLDDQDGRSFWKKEDVSNGDNPNMSSFCVEEIWAAGNSVRIVYEIPTAQADGYIKIFIKPIEGTESDWSLAASCTGIKPDMVVDSGNKVMLGMIFQATATNIEPMILKVQNLSSYSSILGNVNLVAQHKLIYREFIPEVEVQGDENFIMEGNVIVGLTDKGKTLTEVEIPSEINGVEVVRIGQKAFMGSEIQSITIPASITHIGDEAFRGIDTLDMVTFAQNSKLIFVGDSAFRECSALSSITLPKGVKSIGELAFYRCAENKYGELYSYNSPEKQYYASKFTYEFLGEDVMPIGGYIEPSVGYLKVTLEEAIKTMLDSGTNMMIAIGQGRYGTTYQNYFDMLTYLEKHGGMMLKNGLTQYTPDYNGRYDSMNQTLQDVLTYYSDVYASYAGHHVTDEPGVTSWIPEIKEYYLRESFDSDGDGVVDSYDYAVSEQDMGQTHLAWTEHYNRKLYYVNLLPINSPVNAFIWGADGYSISANTDRNGDYVEYADYDLYYKTYIKNVKPRVFSYDFYPLWANGMGNQAHLNYPELNGRHFEQLYKTHYYTQEYSTKVNGFAIPFWNFVQVTSWGNQYSGSRSATYNELLWQVNTALAFGSKGYQYFIFNDYGDRSGAGEPSGYGNLPMNIDGTKGEAYDDVTNVNRQSQAMAKWLLNANVDHIAQVGSNPNGETINSAMFKKADANMNWRLSSTSGKNHLVSYMKYYANNNDYRADNDGDVRELYFVCNNSNLTNNNGSITLNFNGVVSGRYIYNGVEYAFSGSSLTVPNTVAGSGFAVLLDK